MTRNPLRPDKHVLVSILVPARNEERHISQFLNDATQACDATGVPYEMLVIESGSVDRTAEKVSSFARSKQNVRLIHLETPGYGVALIEGIASARGEYLIIFNVDLWDVRFLNLSKVDNLGYDIVNGSKLLPGSFDGRGLYRRLISRVFNFFFLRMLLGYRGTDTHGLKALKASTVLPILRQCVTNSDIFDTELMVRSQRAGLRILEIPVSVKEIRPTRFAGKRIVRIPRDILRLYAVLHASRLHLAKKEPLSAK